MSDPVLLTPQEAGARLGVSHMTIRRMVAAGLLAYVDASLPGSRRTRLRIDPTDLDAYIQQHKRVVAIAGRRAA